MMTLIELLCWWRKGTREDAPIVVDEDTNTSTAFTSFPTEFAKKVSAIYEHVPGTTPAPTSPSGYGGATGYSAATGYYGSSGYGSSGPYTQFPDEGLLNELKKAIKEMEERPKPNIDGERTIELD
jgi:hypothetical protein